MKRPIESLEHFKARIAAIINDKSGHITGAREPHPMLVRKRQVIRTTRTSKRVSSRVIESCLPRHWRKAESDECVSICRNMIVDLTDKWRRLSRIPNDRQCLTLFGAG